MAGKCSIRVDKVKNIKGLQNHNNRIKIKDDAKPYIDNNRTKLNYDLIMCDDNIEKTINEKLNSAGLTRKIRKDSARAGSFVINAPTNNNHKLNKEFFIDCLNFIANLVGSNNIISAKVHNDEKTPHLHLIFVPISEKLNKKNEKIKTLSFNDFFGKKKQLQDLQTNFYLEVGKKYGLERGVPSNKKHISTREYRANKKCVELLNKNEELETKMKEWARNYTNELEKSLEIGEFQSKTLFGKFKRLGDLFGGDAVGHNLASLQMANKALIFENKDIKEAAQNALEQAKFIENNFKKEVERQVLLETKKINNELSLIKDKYLKTKYDLDDANFELNEFKKLKPYELRELAEKKEQEQAQEREQQQQQKKGWRGR